MGDSQLNYTKKQLYSILVSFEKLLSLGPLQTELTSETRESLILGFIQHYRDVTEQLYGQRAPAVSLSDLSVDSESDPSVALDDKIPNASDTVVPTINAIRSKHNLIELCFHDISQFLLQHAGSDSDRHTRVVDFISHIRQLDGASGLDTTIFQTAVIPAPSQELHPPKKDFFKTYGPAGWTQKNCVRGLLSFFPVVGKIRAYPRNWKSNLFGDLTAALSVGFLLVPQGLSYSQLAGLPPIYGLYTAFVPSIIYSIFGTSSEVNVGPVALVSTVLSSAIPSVYQKESKEYIQAALSLTFLSGCILILARLLHVGFLIENLLSLPVLSGFIGAAALLIGISQFKNFFRLKHMHSASNILEYGRELRNNFGEADGWTTLIAILSLILILCVRKYKRTIPIAFIVMVIVTVLVWTQQWDQSAGIEILGAIPSGLPAGVNPLADLTSENIGSRLNLAFSLALLGVIETLSVGKRYALKRGYSVDGNQEFMGLGLANLVGSFFSSYPASGSLSRTAENYFSNAKTAFTGIMVAIFIMIALYATSLFYYTPKCVLGAVVVAAAVNLFPVKEVKWIWRVRRSEIFPFGATFVGTLLLGPENGVLLAIVMSLAQVLWNSAHPNVVVLGRLPGTLIYKDMNRFPDAAETKGVLVIRMDARLYFANMLWFRERVQAFISNAMRRGVTSRNVGGGLAIPLVPLSPANNVKLLETANGLKTGTSSHSKMLPQEEKPHEDGDGHVMSARNALSSEDRHDMDRGIDEDIDADDRPNPLPQTPITVWTDRAKITGGAGGSPLHTVVLDASGINDIDSTAAHGLEDMCHHLALTRVRFLWAAVKGPVRDFMVTTGVADTIGSSNFFLTVHDAVSFAINDSTVSGRVESVNVHGSTVSESSSTTESLMNRIGDRAESQVVKPGRQRNVSNALD